jgi:hypothetical protein
VNVLRHCLGALGAIGTKTVFWPLVLANGGTLICLIAGRSNVIASGFGVAMAVIGAVLMVRFAVTRGQSNSPKTKAL